MAENNPQVSADALQISSLKVAFISGPLDPDDEYFEKYYRRRIDTAMEAGHSFVIGPVAGIDTMSLHYLLSKAIDPSRITIYMAHFEYVTITWRSQYTSLGVNVRDVEDAVTTRDRDAAMTRHSDYDILRYRTEQEAKKLYGSMWWPRVSNTEMNERRRRGIVSEAYVSEARDSIEITREERNKDTKKGDGTEKKSWRSRLRDKGKKLL